MIAGIIGAAGYAGAELVRLLLRHPGVDSLILGSVSSEGERIDRIYPNFTGKIDAVLKKPDAVITGSDVVFAALPHGVGEPYARACIEKGKAYKEDSSYKFYNTTAA
jgi:N-acetyl-gamma-glutamyl-phosphate reductase